MRHNHRIALALTALIVVAASAGCAARAPASTKQAPVIDTRKVIDLSHTFGPDTIFWPTAEPFKLRRVAYGRNTGGYWYAANNISMAEHGGTHMDAPIHFAEKGIDAADVPLANCIGPAVVIDVADVAARDADYRLTVADVEAWERKHGRISRGTIVVMRSGWSSRWPDRKGYLGTDVPLDVAGLHFPGYSKEVAELLVRERDVAALAIDTASIDYGQSKDFIVHQVLNAANKPGFENVANVDRLPPTGATFIALPLKIKDGSGGPTRIIAVLP